VTKRVLVAEELADRGLESMRAAGLDVDVRVGLTPEELLDAVPGVAALVIRSATQRSRYQKSTGRYRHANYYLLFKGVCSADCFGIYNSRSLDLAFNGALAAEFQLPY
jgi:hypothetical protein